MSLARAWLFTPALVTVALRLGDEQELHVVPMPRHARQSQPDGFDDATLPSEPPDAVDQGSDPPYAGGSEELEMMAASQEGREPESEFDREQDAEDKVVIAAVKAMKSLRDIKERKIRRQARSDNAMKAIKAMATNVLQAPARHDGETFPVGKQSCMRMCDGHKQDRKICHPCQAAAAWCPSFSVSEGRTCFPGDTCDLCAEVMLGTQHGRNDNSMGYDEANNVLDNIAPAHPGVVPRGFAGGVVPRGFAGLGELSSKTTVAQSAGAGTAPWDCDDALAEWKTGWSDAKKAWCCANVGKGCQDHVEPVPPSLSQLSAATSPAAQGSQNQKTFDCQQGLKRWETDWSEEKKDFCCQTTGLTCGQHKVANAALLQAAAAASSGSSSEHQHSALEVAERLANAAEEAGQAMRDALQVTAAVKEKAKKVKRSARKKARRHRRHEDRPRDDDDDDEDDDDED